MNTFENWCALNDVQPIPAAPADVAKFITDCAPLGMEKLWPMVGEISRAHYLVGLADPTLGGWVAHAVNEIAGIDAPRSWPKEHKARFKTLPYDLQSYLAAHEKQRETTVARALGEAAEARKQLTAIQQPPAKATADGNISHTTAQ